MTIEQIAQVAHESGNFNFVKENLNYKAELDGKNNGKQTMSEVKKMLQEKFGTNHKYNNLLIKVLQGY